ncbi:unnamed protein product [Clavelina lepadiformis]|uniref:Uncharacterized protein n=1 Tax=Clavelina lepadiformis TaxID=159417 RepID=A0ABP0GUT3_CLALP
MTCKSFNYIENDYICHINEKDRASSDPPDEDLYQFRGRWVPRIKGLIEMKDSTYYSRDYYQLKKVKLAKFLNYPTLKK